MSLFCIAGIDIALTKFKGVKKMFIEVILMAILLGITISIGILFADRLIKFLLGILNG